MNSDSLPVFGKNGCLPEILAPCGSEQSLIAAVRSGADAVYLGGSVYNARRAADNFDNDALSAAVAYCHGRGVKVYFTLNTLIRQAELNEALSLARLVCELGVDAIILQDLGLAGLIRAAAPDMPLHASTQLSCHTPEGIRFLADAGFDRVVLAREMSRDEISLCAGQGAELEVFVHGAACMSVSGKCLMSAVFGGRSGNRGMCAQPCRLPFSANGKIPTENTAALSLKDLSLLEHVNELKSLGVNSFKIEGRMKRPEYVAATVACFSAAVRGLPVSKQELDDLQAVFSRSGFTDGYFTGQRLGMFGIRTHDDVRAAAPVLSRLRQSYAVQCPRIPIRMTFYMRRGQPVSLAAQDGLIESAAALGAPEEAISRETDKELITAQLQKTGGTPFYVTEVTCDIDEGLSVPVSQINTLRRRVLDALIEKRAITKPVQFNADIVPRNIPVAASSPTYRPSMLMRLSHHSQLPDDIDGKGIMAVLPVGTPDDVLRMISGKMITAVEIPRTLFDCREQIEEALHNAVRAGVKAALCNNIGAVPIAEQAGLSVISGWSLGITNAEALDFWVRRGVSAAIVSPELTFAQMRFSLNNSTPVGIFAYGRLPLMHVRCCPVQGNNGGCGTCDGSSMLTDRRGVKFGVSCGGYRKAVEILNSVPIYWADKLGDLPKVDLLYLHFTDETADEVSRVMWEYRHGGNPRKEFTRGLYRHGCM